jgi:hypothetical protein
MRQAPTPGAPRKPAVGATYGRLTHLTVEDAQDAPDIVYNMFLVQGVLASVLFDSGATCSYISSKFARERSTPVTPQSVPIDTISPLGTTRSTKIYKGVRITIEGCTFLADLILLPSEGLDVILDMDWLTLHKGIIYCSPRYVEITHPSGRVIRCEPHHKKIDALMSALEAKSVEEVPIVCEYPDVFPEELPGMPPDRDIEFVIDLLAGTRPIAKRPYRMSVDELEELKKQLRELSDKGYIKPSASP